MSLISFWPKHKIKKIIQRASCLDAEKASSGAGSKSLAVRHPRLFAVYKAMLQRCNDPNYHNYSRYGGRGIRVCRRWRGKKGFLNVLADMGEPPSPELTIERTDNNGNYSSENCRWATRSEQGRNKRTNRYVDYHGERRLLIELAEEHSIPYKQLHRRVVSRGWSLERALTQPLKAQPQLRRDGVARRRLVELAKKAGVPYKLFHQRHVQRGWTLERALAEPPRRAPGAA